MKGNRSIAGRLRKINALLSGFCYFTFCLVKADKDSGSAEKTDRVDARNRAALILVGNVAADADCAENFTV